MSVTVRAATPSDAAALAGFGAETFLNTFGHLYSEDDKSFFLEERFSQARTLADIAEAGRYLQLAFQGDTMVGFLDCGRLGLPVAEPEPQSVEVYRLYLAPSQFGTGLAGRLMAMAIDWARTQKAPALYLGVFNANHRAKAFYTKFGFEIVGAYHFKVGNTLDDERIMRLAL
jgi:diamine N-acetyltransferase